MKIKNQRQRRGEGEAPSALPREGATRGPVIDFHTHFFPDKLLNALWRWFEKNAWPIHYKMYADEMVKTLKQNGVTRAVSLHYPHQSGMAASLNEWTYRLAQAYPDFLIPFGSLHPDDRDKESLLKTCFEEYGFSGLKFHCHVQKMAPEDKRMEPVYEICQDLGKIVLIHCGTGPHFKENPERGYGYDVTTLSGVEHFERVLKKYPRLKFVVTHLGFEEMEEFVGLLGEFPNLFLDTTMTLSSFFPNPVKREWLSDHADRILFGTDFPNIPYEWGREKKGLEDLKLGREKEAMIL